MKGWQSHAHVKWECEYRVVIFHQQGWFRWIGHTWIYPRSEATPKGQEQDGLHAKYWPLLGAFLIPPALPVVDD